MHTRRPLTRDWIRSAARTAGRGTGDHWDDQKQPGQSGSTRSEDSSSTIFTGLAEDATQGAVEVHATTYHVTQH